MRGRAMACALAVVATAACRRAPEPEHTIAGQCAAPLGGVATFASTGLLDERRSGGGRIDVRFAGTIGLVADAFLLDCGGEAPRDARCASFSAIPAPPGDARCVSRPAKRGDRVDVIGTLVIFEHRFFRDEVTCTLVEAPRAAPPGSGTTLPP